MLIYLLKSRCQQYIHDHNTRNKGALKNRAPQGKMGHTGQNGSLF